MAFGNSPCSSSSASSSSIFGHHMPSSTTLSPLAPPFTVDRLQPNACVEYPNTSLAADDGRFASVDSSSTSAWGTLSSRFIQAKPFYPQYVRGPENAAVSGSARSVGFDADCHSFSDLERPGRVQVPWNGPFYEGGGRGSDVGEGNSTWFHHEGKGFSGAWSPWENSGEKGDHQSSSWEEPSDSQFACTYAASVGHDSVSSQNFLPFENSWPGKNAEHCVKNSPVESSCKELIDDKHYSHIQGRAAVPRMSAALDLPPSIVNASFPSSSSAITPLDISNSYPHDCLSAQTGSVQNKQWDISQDTAFHSPGPFFLPVTNSMQKDPYLHISPMDGFSGDDHNKAHISSRFLGIAISPKVEIKHCPDRKKSNDKCTIDTVLALSEKSLKENLLTADLKMATHELGNYSIMESNSKATELNVQTEVKRDYSNRISSEESDHLGVDSPCWKGNLASRSDPFHVENIPHVIDFFEDEKVEDSNKKVSNSLTVIADQKNNMSDGLDLQNEDLPPNDLKSCSPLKLTGDGSDSACLKPPSGNKCSFPFCDIFSGPSIQDETFYAHSTTDGKISFPSMHEDYDSDKMKETLKTSYSKEVLHGNSDAYYLVRSLYDLSKFLSSHCCDRNMLKEDDYELLLMATENLDTCISKWVELHGFQARFSNLQRKPPASLEVLDLRGNLSSQISGLKKDNPDKPHDFRSDPNNEFGSRSMDFNRSDGISEIIEQSMKNIFYTENPDTNLYRIRWIEAEAALCSARCELYLSRMKDHTEKCKQMVTDFQVSVDADQEFKREVEVPAVSSSVHELTALGRLIHASRDDNSQDFIPGKPQELFSSVTSIVEDADVSVASRIVPSSITSKSEDADASIMSRFKVLKDRIDKVEYSEVQQKLKDSMAAGNGLDAKSYALHSPLSNDVNAGIHFQASASSSSPCGVHRPLDTEDGCTEVKNVSNMQYFRSNYCKPRLDEHYLGTSSDNKVTPHTSASFDRGDRRREFSFDVGNRSILQMCFDEVNQIEGYCSSKNDVNSFDWEHVQEEEIRW